MEQNDFKELIRLVSTGDLKKCHEFLSKNFSYHKGTVQVLARISKYQEDKRLGTFIQGEERAEYGAIIAEVLKVAQELKERKIPSENLILVDHRTGIEYGTTIIDGLIWTSEDFAWIGETSGSRGYNWYWDEIISNCPPGWHIPSNDEWTKLFSFFGGYRYLPTSGIHLVNHIILTSKGSIVGKNPHRAFKALTRGGISGLNLDPDNEYWSLTKGGLTKKLNLRSYYATTYTLIGNGTMLLTHTIDKHPSLRVRLVRDY